MQVNVVTDQFIAFFNERPPADKFAEALLKERPSLKAIELRAVTTGKLIRKLK